MEHLLKQSRNFLKHLADLMLNMSKISNLRVTEFKY